ncbi:MAG TPA: nucleotidyltransferase domain-containing protein [Cytophagaceae bacterium]|jgi:hypothetical protein
MDLAVISEKIKGYFEDKPIKKVFIFGSYSRNEQTPKSDIDILISMDMPVGLFKLAQYSLDLESLLGIKVDLGTEGGVSQEAWPYIEKDMKLVYER